MNPTEENATASPKAAGARNRRRGRKPPEPHGLQVIKASDVALGRVQYAWEGRVVIGGANLFPGEEGIGKSIIIGDLAAQLTRGELPGEWHGRPRNVVVVAPEDNLKAVVRPRLDAAKADLDRVFFVQGRVAEDGTESELIIPRDLGRLGRLISQKRVGLLWIDSLVTTLHENVRSVSYKDVSTVLKRLGEFAEDFNIAVVAPWHLNKNKGSDTALRMMDSRAFRTASRSILLVVSDPSEPDEGLVALDKHNAGPMGIPAMRFRIEGHSYTVQETNRKGQVIEKLASAGKVIWMGEEVGDGRTVARSLLISRMAAPDSARAWLGEYLADQGETLRKDVMAAGAEAEHSEDALQRAARALNVIFRNTLTVPRKTYWRLPGQPTR